MLTAVEPDDQTRDHRERQKQDDMLRIKQFGHIQLLAIPLRLVSAHSAPE